MTAAEAADALEAQYERRRKASLTPGATQRTERGLRRASDPSAIAEKFQLQDAAEEARRAADADKGEKPVEATAPAELPARDRRRSAAAGPDEHVWGGVHWSNEEISNIRKRAQELYGY